MEYRPIVYADPRIPKGEVWIYKSKPCEVIGPDGQLILVAPHYKITNIAEPKQEESKLWWVTAPH